MIDDRGALPPSGANLAPRTSARDIAIEIYLQLAHSEIGDKVEVKRATCLEVKERGVKFIKSFKERCQFN